jgi:hypothetical protein
MQQIGGQVILFEDYTERQIVRFDPSSPDTVKPAQDIIDASELNDEDKVFAHFWAGYFAAYAGHPELERPGAVSFDEALPLVHVFGPDGSSVVVNFDPADQNATAQAQKAIYDSALSGEDKRCAYFWSGYFYARASVRA